MKYAAELAMTAGEVKDYYAHIVRREASLGLTNQCTGIAHFLASYEKLFSYASNYNKKGRAMKGA